MGYNAARFEGPAWPSLPDLPKYSAIAKYPIDARLNPSSMAPQPIGTKKTPVGAPKAIPPPKKSTALTQTKTVPYKKPAVTPAKKPINTIAKKPTKKPAAAPAKKSPQQQSWLTRTTNAAATGVGNFGGAIVTAAGNGVAGAGKGAGARYVPGSLFTALDTNGYLASQTPVEPGAIWSVSTAIRSKT